MQLNKKTIKKILKENKDLFKTLENYDKTRELPFQRKRIDITLSVRTINKLKSISAKIKKPISRIIEERIQESSLPKTHPKLKEIKPLEPSPLNAEPIPSYIG